MPQGDNAKKAKELLDIIVEFSSQVCVRANAHAHAMCMYVYALTPPPVHR
jgi:hypothetical protein